MKLPNLFRLVLAFFQRFHPQPMDESEKISVAPLLPMPPPCLASEPSASSEPSAPTAEMGSTPRLRRRSRGVLRLKRTILDQLIDNNKIMIRMKAYFPGEYARYSQIGAALLPLDKEYLNDTDLLNCPVSPWFIKTRPSFGAVACGNPYDSAERSPDHHLHPRLIHFLKIKERLRTTRMFDRNRETIQPIAPTSDLYIFTNYYDEKDWARLFPKKSRSDWRLAKFYERAFAIEIPIELTRDGRVRPLKILRSVRLPHINNDKPPYVAEVNRWDYPYTKEFIKNLKDNLSPEQYEVLSIAKILACYEESTSSMIQVRASKDNICALINVNVEQTPDFFNDREAVIEDGVKKRIFHIVRAHHRVGSKGVKLHFRGLRAFSWNGYQIEISVPNRDHFDSKEFDVAAVDEEDLVDKKGIDMSQLAGWIVASQRARFGAMVGKRGDAPPLP